MLKQLAKPPTLLIESMRYLSTSKRNDYKVAVCGASGGVGQPLSLLIKLNPLVTDLTLYDLTKTVGTAADLSHIDTLATVSPFEGPDNLVKVLHCADIVVIPAGLPRKPGMERDDLFTKNADVIKCIASVAAKVCPKALIAIITNPVNSCVPIAAEIMKAAGAYDPKRLFGVTTLDVVRSRAFIGQIMMRDPQKIRIPVIGGHSGITILPVISNCKPSFPGDEDDVDKLTKRIQNAGTEIVKAKAGGGSATLSMGYAGAHFVGALLRALDGDKSVVECTYVESKVTEAAFFSTPIKLGQDGVKENLGLPDLNSYEKQLLDCLLPELKKDIQKGIDFAKKK